MFYHGACSSSGGPLTRHSQMTHKFRFAMQFNNIKISILLVAVMLLNIAIAAALIPKPFQNFRTASLSAKNALYSSASSSSSQESAASVYGKSIESKGNILLLGGSGFLGSAIAKRALMEGYEVTSISRRGKQQQQSAGVSDGSKDDVLEKVKFILGDARNAETIQQILSSASEEKQPYTAVIHSIGLLLDGKSGLGKYNQFVSGSGSTPDKESTYDDITRRTAFNAIDAVLESSNRMKKQPMPFVFISAAEAGWPDMPGGSFVEKYLAPEWLRRYLDAKRTVEQRLMSTDAAVIRPIIFRPSLIFSFDRLMSLAPVGAFFVGNKIGLPFVDRPVTVQALAAAVVRSLEDEDIQGVQRYKEIDALGSK